MVDLASEHGWERGDRIMLYVSVAPGQDALRAVAVAVVIESYPDFVQVALLYQSEAVSLSGAIGRRVTDASRGRLAKFVGGIVELQESRVRINVGKDDGVLNGDIYQILSSSTGQPIGRLKVTEVDSMFAWATPLDLREPFLQGQSVVYISGAVADEKRSVSILIVNFDPHDPRDPEEAKSGRGFAKGLADALTGITQGSLGARVLYAANEHVEIGEGDAAAHKKAGLIGKRYGASIVIWGSMRIGMTACAQPRFTVVDEDWLRERTYRGTDIWMERDAGGISFKGDTPAEPLALAAAILGSVAYDAQRYADAAYYLSVAVNRNVLRGEDDFAARKRLTHAMYERGQTAAARQHAEEFIRRARAVNEEQWEHWGRIMLARVDAREGRVDAALANLKAVETWSTARGAQDLLSSSLFGLAKLDEQQGKTEEARAFYKRALDLDRRTGNVDGEVNVLYSLARLEAEQGRVDEARKLYEQSLEINRRIGSIQGEAATLHQLGALEAQQGRVAEARKLYEQSLGLKRRIGDVHGTATTLHRLATLEAQQGRVQEALKLYERSLELERRIGSIQGEAATLHQLGALWALQGRLEPAHLLYARSLELKRRIGDIRGEAATLHNIAVLRERAGQVTEARKLYQQSLELERRIGNVDGEYASVVNLAVLDYREGKRDVAKRTLENAFAHARTIQHVELQLGVLRLLAEIETDQWDLANARQRWTEAKALYDRLQMSVEAEAVDAKLAELSVLERVLEAWKAHASDLAVGGVLIKRVLRDGPAARVGLEAGDILLRYNGARVVSPDALKITSATKSIAVEILRGPKRMTLYVRPGPLGVTTETVPKMPPTVASEQKP